MILKGSQRGNAAQLARHLLNDRDNEHVELHENRGFLCADLANALAEADVIAKGTRRKQFLFSLSLSPPEAKKVPTEVFKTAIEMIEQNSIWKTTSERLSFTKRKASGILIARGPEKLHADEEQALIDAKAVFETNCEVLVKTAEKYWRRTSGTGD